MALEGDLTLREPQREREELHWAPLPQTPCAICMKRSSCRRSSRTSQMSRRSGCRRSRLVRRRSRHRSRVPTRMLPRSSPSFGGQALGERRRGGWRAQLRCTDGYKAGCMIRSEMKWRRDTGNRRRAHLEGQGRRDHRARL